MMAWWEGGRGKALGGKECGVQCSLALYYVSREEQHLEGRCSIMSWLAMGQAPPLTMSGLGIQ